MSIGILPYGPASESTIILRDEINSIVNEHPAIRLRFENSSYAGNREDVLVNWGNSSVDNNEFNRMVGFGSFLNHPRSVASASNKLYCLTALATEIPTVSYTSNPSIARQWIAAGHGVYARTRLQGHSGEGIIYCYNSEIHSLDEHSGSVNLCNLIENAMPQAPLYTKAIVGQRREFRFHWFKGKLISVQLKKRRNNYRQDPSINYSNIIRNYGTGWIYASLPSNTRPNRSAIEISKRAVDILGLDFGVVDVVTKGNNAWILEVNTAPGISSLSNRRAYANAIINFATGNPIEEADLALPESELEGVEINVNNLNTANLNFVQNQILSDFNNARSATITSSMERVIRNSNVARTVSINYDINEFVFQAERAFSALGKTIYEVEGCVESDVDSMFTWSDTPQGSDYWNSLQERCFNASTNIPIAPVEDGIYLNTIPEPIEPPRHFQEPVVRTRPNINFSGDLIDKALYVISVNNELMYGEYQDSVSSFYTIGYDIPLTTSDIDVVELVRESL